MPVIILYFNFIFKINKFFISAELIFFSKVNCQDTYSHRRTVAWSLRLRTCSMVHGEHGEGRRAKGEGHRAQSSRAVLKVYLLLSFSFCLFPFIFCLSPSYVAQSPVAPSPRRPVAQSPIAPSPRRPVTPSPRRQVAQSHGRKVFL